MSLNSPFKHRLLSILLCVLGLGFGFGSDALKLPFRVNDVLPVLPHQISWPVLNNFHSAVDLLPAFVGSVSPNNGTLEWKGACFYGNEARLEFTESDRDEPTLGGGVLYLKVTLLVLLFLFVYIFHFVKDPFGILIVICEIEKEKMLKASDSFTIKGFETDETMNVIWV